MAGSIGEGHMILQSVLTDKGTPGADEDGDTPPSSSSSSAASGAGLRTLLTLLEHGALPNMTNFHGHTAISLLATSTAPHSAHTASQGSSEASLERWAGGYDSAIVMLLSHGARLSFVHPSSGSLSAELPHHWNNPPVQSALEEGAAVWAKKEQLDGDVAGMRSVALLCFCAVLCYSFLCCAVLCCANDLRCLRCL
jgi:hypothetical protein